MADFRKMKLISKELHFVFYGAEVIARRDKSMTTMTMTSQMAFPNLSREL
jgi:hypothetical protein